MQQDMGERIQVVKEEILSHNWYLLKKATFDFRRRDGSWQRQTREVYDRGHGAVIALFNPRRRTVILTRQFRYPAYANDPRDAFLIEACAGLLDDADPVTRIQHEAQEETGYRARQPRKVFECYMSPGSVTEKLHFFVAEYDSDDRLSAGGGAHGEGEDIEVLELPLDEALAMTRDGRIQDAKTVMLLQHLALNELRASPST